MYISHWYISICKNHIFIYYLQRVCIYRHVCMYTYLYIYIYICIYDYICMCVMI